MKSLISRVRKPVRREGSESYLLVTLMSFGLSVALTRLFLEMTGYPQLGGSELHFAHVLWGGLLLFIAALLPLIFANRWVYTLGALLGGVGVGLFIDEVGKFITQSNDYFYPPAAPIIYAFFLLTVLLYLQVRRPPPRDVRHELYHVFDALQEVLDHDLDPVERADLEDRLHLIARTSPHPNLGRLAGELLDFIASDALELANPQPSMIDRLRERSHAIEHRWVTRWRIKAALIGGMTALGIWSLLKLVRLVLASLSPARLEQMVADILAVGRVDSASGLSWFFARLALEGVVGVILILATLLLLLGYERRGVELSYLGLLLSLTAVNLLIFFYDQFSTIVIAGVQFSLLLVVLYFRRKFLLGEESALSEEPLL